MKKMLLIMFIIMIVLVSNLSAQKADRIGGASLSGDNSVPPVTTSATGTMTGVLTNNWTELHYSITIEGLTPTAAHFHNGAFDATGGVVKALDFTGGMTISGVWSASDVTQPFTTEMLDELLAGRIYVNVHTSANPGGEIRGNIATVVPFKASLSGDKIVPTPVVSSGVGTGVVLLVGSERVVSYGLNVTGLTPTNSHFHGGSATATGGVVKGITLVDDNAVGEWLGDDTQPLTDLLISDLLLGNIYMNIHTSANPGGEIRSQMEREDATTFMAFINGGNHTPSISSTGSGLAFLTLNSGGTELTYDITISQITPSAAHFHNAGAGINGGVVKTLNFVDGHASGVWSATDGTQPLTSLLVDELLSGRLYVNVHTTLNPGGEIRGQVRTFSGFNAQLSGSQSVPAVASLAAGTLTSTFFYTDSGAVLEYDITVEGLTITNSHFHAGTADGTGGVVKAITFNGNSAHGIWSANDAQPLTDDIVDMIRSGGIYVNIHTSANPGGEIRGQLLPGIIDVPDRVIVKVREDRITGASLTGGNSVPPVTTSATGTFTGALTNDWTELHYSITIEGLTPTAAHFHNGAFDATGGVVKALDFTGGMTISGVWSASDVTQPFTTEMLDELLAGRIYVNVHTSANPGGEIRGNIATVVPFKASLSGDKIVPTPVVSSGVGTGVVLLVGSERVVSYGLNVTGLTPTNSHFHGGSATATGGVVKGITLVDDNAVGEWLGDDTQPLTDLLISDLLLGNIYMNIHTSANPGGEIRSQMEREDATTFMAFINGGNHTPSISSTGSGLAFLTLNSGGTELTYDITISQITPSAAHFHNAGAGINGGVVKTLNFVDGHASGVWSATDGTQPLTSLLVDELLSGRLYVNVHTTLNPGGEIRGQVRTFSGFNAQLSGSQSVPAVASLAAGTLTSTFFYTDSGAVLEYDITVEGLTITNSHFHAGTADGTGGVIKAITFEGNSAHGVWSASDVTQPLTDDIVDMIRSGGVYVNIHTAANPGGEIRGQLLPGIMEVPQIFPIISNIEDVPDDQGGWIYLRWLASDEDALGNITQYGILELNVANEWVSLGSVPSTQLGEYIFPAHTFQDSSDQGIYWSKFRVSAHTTDPEVFYLSKTDSGFSVDNLSPAVPSGLLASITEEDAVQLTWDAPVDADFEYFRIYRSTESGFDPSVIEPYSESIGTMFIDTEVSIDLTYYYILSAVDAHGNESGFSEEVSATIVGIEEGEIIPEDFVLFDAFPNPFNPSTTIKYGLPYQSDATLIIYNLMGQEIMRWDENDISAGYYSKTWNGTNKFGVPVVSGVYLYRFVAGDFVVTRKMVLLK